MLWQKAFIECLYSFKIAETGFDRFKRSILLIGRKNTKSETCNGLGFSELMIGNPGSDIVCSSNDDSQANILFDGINTMREMFDPKNKRTHKNLSFIKNKKTGSKVFKLSDRTRNKEGRNIDFAIIDEVHEMTDKTIIESIDQSQSLKDNPKRIIITTEGFTNNGALDDELIYARKVLNGEYEDDTILIWLYTQDSEQEIWQDESSWMKSNPTVGIVKKYDYLRERLNKAKIDKATRVFTLCKDFNIKQNAAVSWLMQDEYSYPQEVTDLEQFRGCFCLAAVDLAETTDLTNAKILLMRQGDTTKYVYSHYWIPESKLHLSDDHQAGAKYRDWAKAGLLTVCPGNDNDLSVVADWLASLKTKYGIKVFKCGYDVKFSKDFLNRMEEYGIDTELIQQSKDVMSTPMKLVEADLKGMLINYGNNPMDAWCLGNASMELDDRGRVFCVKIPGQPNRRIDGAVTLIILYATYIRFRSEFARYIK
jgi:phage terminase large subunit-like protein